MILRKRKESKSYVCRQVSLIQENVIGFLLHHLNRVALQHPLAVHGREHVRDLHHGDLRLQEQKLSPHRYIQQLNHSQNQNQN